MRQDPFRSDLRVCALGEPKSEQSDHRVNRFSRLMKAGNVLSEIESEGLRAIKGFDPELSETEILLLREMSNSAFGTSSGKSVLKNRQRDSWMVLL